MGDIADMMLDGTLCEGCGVALENSLGDFPQRCDDCKRNNPEPTYPGTFIPPAEKVACPTCGKRVKDAGLKDHMRDKHERFA